jgi:signal peptide peptidase SppA
MSDHRLPLLAEKIFNRPLMIHPGKAEIILAAIGPRFGVAAIQPGAWAAWSDDDPAASEDRDHGYDLVNGVAVIPIEGTLVQKNYCLRSYSGMTGYDGIRCAFMHACANPSASAIVLDIDSPGGEVAGCFDLVDLISSARGTKPIWAILTESAYSAAYAIASAADRIVVPRTGGAGSIGVIAVLAEMSGLLKKEGVTVNIIQFGARKADGNPYEALPAEARARFQEQIDKLGELFVETVAENRGISPDAVRGLEAATFMADEALKLKLVDAVMAPEDAFQALLATL